MIEHKYTLIGNLLVWGLITGTLLSYLPQYIKIYKNSNARGISETSIVFGIYSCMFNILGTIQEDYKNISKCSINKDCYDTIMPIIQLTAPGLCIVILYIFFVYFSKSNETTPLLQHNRHICKSVYKRSKIHLTINLLLIAAFVLTSNNLNYNSIQRIGKIYNLISVVFSLIMWLPQIYTTFQIKNDYSLSLLALSIHSIGCFITVIYQYFIVHQSILVILNYLVGGLCEAFIVCIVFYFRRNYKYQTYPAAIRSCEYTTL